MNRISELRRRKGWTQVDLASMLNVKRQTVGNYETGSREIDAPTICRLCEIFGCTADYLLGRSPLSSADLDPEEEALLLAFRAATPEIRSIVANALERYKKEEQSAAGISYTSDRDVVP